MANGVGVVTSVEFVDEIVIILPDLESSLEFIRSQVGSTVLVCPLDEVPADLEIEGRGEPGKCHNRESSHFCFMLN